MSARRVVVTAFALLLASSTLFAQIQNQGLVGVVQIPANTLDKTGNDTFGGISGMTIIPDRNPILPWKPSRGRIYHATLLAVTDRGFGEGMLGDYSPRLHQLRLTIRPTYNRASPINEMTVALERSTILTYGVDTKFTGYDADPDNFLAPTSFKGQIHIGDVVTPLSLGFGRRSLDPEGVTRAKDGTLWIADEYEPRIHHFTADGKLIKSLEVPAAVVPRRGDTFGQRRNDYGATPLSGGDPATGRRDDRGFEGVSITPDNKRLVAVLQSPLVQDSGSGASPSNTATNTRIIVWDLDPNGRTEKLTAEYVYQLTKTTAADGERTTTLRDVIALNEHQFLVLEEDDYGRGQTGTGATDVAPSSKRVVFVDASNATNIYHTGYDLELGDTNQTSLPENALNGLTPVSKTVLIDLLDATELGRFGINVGANAGSNNNTAPASWEAMTLLPVNEAAAPDDYLLLIANDNGYRASTVVQNGETVGTNATTVDTTILAYRVTLPNAH